MESPQTSIQSSFSPLQQLGESFSHHPPIPTPVMVRLAGLRVPPLWDLLPVLNTLLRQAPTFFYSHSFHLGAFFFFFFEVKISPHSLFCKARLQGNKPRIRGASGGEGSHGAPAIYFGC